MSLKNNGFTKGLLECFGWDEIESKQSGMISYYHEDLKKRLNYYFTTGTVMIQGAGGNPEIHREIFSDEQIEEILCQINKKN